LRAKIGVISLGCAKNRVDTETMLGALSGEYEFVQDMEQADIALINTCSFINDAKEESINTILEAEQLKRFGHLKGIIVTGCLTERFHEELKELMPRVDAFLGVAAYKDIASAVEAVLEGKKLTSYEDKTIPEHFLPRMVTTPKPTAYVKIAEGCDNNCSYCVIPQVRGPLQSRKMEDILEETVTLVQNGYQEILFIAQDTTEYGRDIYGESKLPELLDKAAQIPGLKWLRLLYCYPERITEELIDTMLRYETIVKYIDMPIQHFDNEILEAMNRRNTYETTERVVNMIRAKSPDFIIRTTLITGFPGETRQEAKEVSDALHKFRFDRVGVFKYSQEEGTPAGEMPDQIAEDEKEFRRDMLVTVQAGISLSKNKERIGKCYEVLVEGFDKESGLFYGRSYAEAPEIDGKIFVNAGDQKIDMGSFYTVRITHGYHYDLKGELC
jgi:ribosomal protein S12 methylthiotransferase RimO